jgi:RNA polymerase subunit RPABC4/transcription elongation factor Spt4
MSVKYFCQNCGKELEPNQRPCPFCGCNNINVEAVGLAYVGLVATSTLRYRKIGKGFPRFKKEILQGWFPSRNKRRFPEGVDMERIIDKEKDEYHQIVKDAKTGKITHEEHEPLDQHKHP